MPRNTAQQLYDVGYVVYKGREGGRERGGIRRKKEKDRNKRKKVDAKEIKEIYRRKRGYDESGNVTGKKR